MTNTLRLNEKYSTTRLLTKEKPVIFSSNDDKFDSHLFFPKGEGRQGEGGLRTKGYFKQSYQDKPLITIVTVVFNGEKYLEQTIQSVINQTYDNVEYIIMDGGSTDRTLDIIKKYEDQIDYWVSEKDGGIYDAMNKGLICANGKYIAFLNADDWYELDALKTVVQIIMEIKADFVSAKIRIVNEKSKDSVVRKSTFSEYGKNVHHQTSFISLDIHRQFPFNTKYKLAADKDVIVRMLQGRIGTYFIDEVIVNFREGGKGSDILKYQIELFDSNIKNIGFLFATKRLIVNLAAKPLFKLFGLKR